MIVIEICCDGCGLLEQTTASHDDGVNSIDSQLDDGWTHDGGEDFCPDCT